MEHSTLQKYPRTPHLPWSPGFTVDDEVCSDVSHFSNREIVVTEKMDGENTSFYRNHLHARSLDSGHHPSRTWVKQLHAQISQDIPEGWRVCGENLYAKHSLAYDNLPSFFMVFSIWNDRNEALPWSDTEEWSQLLGLVTVPVLYRGPWEESIVRASYNPKEHFYNREGYVVRVADSFAYKDFAKSVGKYVRKNHVQSSEHWMHMQVVPNGLAPSKEECK